MRKRIFFITAVMCFPLQSEETSNMDVNKAILEHLSDYKTDISIKHTPELLNYIKTCKTRPDITIKSFRGRLNKYRVIAECSPTYPHKSVSTITGHIETLVTTAKIKRKTPIKNNLFTKKQSNISSLRGNIAIEIPDAYYMAKSSLDAGEVIYKKHLSVIPTITRGQEVTISVIKQGVNIRVKGVALEEGMENQIIKVQNASSRATFDAIVINNNTVRVK